MASANDQPADSPVPPSRPEIEDDGDDDAPRNWKVLIVGAIVLTLLAIAIWYFLAPNAGSVSGIVTLDDQPLAQAKLIFLRESVPAGPLEAVTNEEGKYTLFGPTSEGVPADSYKVVISKLVRKDRKVVAKSDGTVAAPPESIEVDLVPDRYNDASRTELRAIVSRGGNEISFQLKSTP